MKKLNKRQKKFVELVATGISHGTAYVQAGFSPNGAAQSATNLLKKTYIQEYLLSIKSETNDLAKDLAVNTRLANLQILSAISNDTDEKTSDRISSIKEINTMQDFNKQVEKTENTTGLNVNIEDIRDRIAKYL